MLLLVLGLFLRHFLLLLPLPLLLPLCLLRLLLLLVVECRPGLVELGLVDPPGKELPPRALHHCGVPVPVLDLDRRRALLLPLLLLLLLQGLVVGRPGLVAPHRVLLPREVLPPGALHHQRRRRSLLLPSLLLSCGLGLSLPLSLALETPALLLLSLLELPLHLG